MNKISVNRKAHFDYEILETYEAGIELFGFEVKSVKTGRLNLTGSFAVIHPVRSQIPKEFADAKSHRTSSGVKGWEVWLLNAHIPAYQPKNAPPDYDPTRSRRLLLHKSEIKELIGKSAQKGLTIVPLKVYTKRNRIKILLGLARHKKKTDKRELIKRRETEREIERVLKRP